MKSLIGLLKEKAVLLTLVMAACCFGFVSCGDDEEDAGGPGSEIGSEAPYYGKWQVTHMKEVEDGESFEGNLSSKEIIQLTLNQNGTFVYYVNVTDEEGNETYTQEGTWTYSQNTISMVSTSEGYTEYGKMLVQSWTASSMVTKVDYGHGSYEISTWKRV